MSDDAQSLLTDPQRLDALRRSGLLDSPPEEAFDRLTRLASRILKVPVSLVSLVDADRQFFKSAVGLPEPVAAARQTPLSYSFCQHVVTSGDRLVVEDARTNPLVRDNLAVRDIGVAAYAGFPIVGSDGQALGSFCAIDVVPRAWSEDDLAVLRELSALVVTEIELRDAVRHAAEVARAAERAEAERTAVIESATDGIYTVDVDGRCTFANAAASRLLGFERAALIGQNLHRLIHHHHADGSEYPEDRCPLYQAFRTGATLHVEDDVFWRRDGTPVPVECSSAPLMVAGALAGAVVTFRDISDRVEADRAVRESEAKFRAIFDGAGVGITLAHASGPLLDCNAAFERFIGYDCAELRTVEIDAYTHADDVSAERLLERDLLDGRTPRIQLEKRYIRKSGELVWGRFTATLARDAAGEPRFIVGMVEDVTQRRRAYESVRFLAEAGAALAASLDYEDTLRRVAHLAVPALGDACIVDVLRAEGDYEVACAHVDPELETLLGSLRRKYPLPYSSAGDSAMRAMRTRTPQVVERITSEMRRTFAADAEHFAMLERLDLGSAMHVPLLGVDRVLGVVTFAARARRYTEEDVTLAQEVARRAVSAVENAELYREAQRATRARDEVLAVVSHDLRNPMHTILMSSSLLLELQPPGPSTARTQLEIIHRSTARANRLIQDLLEVTRIENGQLRLDTRPLPIADAIEEALEPLRTRAAERGLTLEIEPGDSSLRALGDRDRIVQVIDNLVGNALKFTPSGGRVSVRATSLDGEVCVAVRDTGPGITPEQQSQLFRRFWQARRTDRRGVGLGLSIAKGIVDAHGGRIWVESTPGEGTTFFFTVAKSEE
jgi:PAS domain S-box-containing protein